MGVFFSVGRERKATVQQRQSSKNKFCSFTKLTVREKNGSGKDIKPNTTRSKIC